LIQAVEEGAVSVNTAADLAQLRAGEQRGVLSKGPKQVRAKVREIRRERHLRAAEKKGVESAPGRYATAEEILSGRLVELIAQYEMGSAERVAGIEIDRDFEDGPVASIRIVHT